MPLPVPRLGGPIELDGWSNEPAWQAVEPVQLIAHRPTFGGEPDEPTEVRIAHDGESLYVAARLYESDPSNIRGLSLKRDNTSGSDDWFVVNLDTFNDKETALSFSTTPTGLRTDRAISDDGQSVNFDWNTFWDVEVAQNEEGWFAEFRIPFSSLRFQDRDGRVVMGLSFFRWIARNLEQSVYPAIPPRWGGISSFKPSQMQEVVLEGVQSTRPLYATPYVLGGGAQAFTLNEAATGYERIDTPAREMGLDLKYGLTDNLTLDLAVNPDFAQVEADEQQVNLTRFSLFYPEKRLFFQERSSAFDFSLGGSDRLFHSRRIGLADGEQVRIWGGGRLVGRIGDWDVGALSMQTGASESLSSENVGVLRLRRGVLNENSYIGGIATSRRGAGGTYNLTYGLDANLRLFDQDYLTLNWAQTFDHVDTGPGIFDRGFARARWERRGTEGFGYAFDLSRVGAAFEPGIGFLLRDDYTRFGDRLYYGWRPGERSSVFRHTLALDGALYRRNADGSTETAELKPEWKVETGTGHTLTLGATSAYEDLEHAFPLGADVEIPAGSYWFHSGRVEYRMPSGSVLRTTVSAEAGSFFDGFRTSFGVAPSWAVSRHLEFGGAYSLDRLVFGERGQRLDAHVARLRALVMLSTRLSASSFLQYSSAADAAIANLRLRYNPREGRDLYLVYNHGIHTDRHSLEPFLPFTDSRTLLVKYSHALDLGF